MYTVIGIGISLGLIAIGALAIIISGAMSLKNGKQDFKKVVTFLVPFVVFGISYAVAGTFNDAGIATMLFMFGVMIILILFTGFRSTFNI